MLNDEILNSELDLIRHEKKKSFDRTFFYFGQMFAPSLLQYSAFHPVIRKVLKMMIWGIPPACGLLL